MNEVTTAIEQILNEAKAIIIDRMIAEGVTATGKSADSLTVVVEGTHGALYGGSWWADIERGHPAGKEVDIADLEDWAAARNYKGDVPSLAAKLETMGSAAWAMGGRQVFSDAIDTFLQNVPERLTGATANYLTRLVLDDKTTTAAVADDDEIPF